MFSLAEERRKKIADLLKAIEERLLSLETEKEELKQYQKWDRSKRGLECAICMAECDDAKKRIDEVNRPFPRCRSMDVRFLDRGQNEWRHAESGATGKRSSLSHRTDSSK